VRHLLLCGHGYLGQAISRDFIAADWQVTPLSRSGGDGSIACDLTSAADVAALEVERPDFIVHCASSGRGGAEAFRAVYLEGCRHLLERFP
nr:sugar nucleotide-binding protein [Shewanella ferrihydritica]